LKYIFLFVFSFYFESSRMFEIYVDVSRHLSIGKGKIDAARAQAEYLGGHH